MKRTIRDPFLDSLRFPAVYEEKKNKKALKKILDIYYETPPTQPLKVNPMPFNEWEE